jgi:hypothetical protein
VALRSQARTGAALTIIAAAILGVVAGYVSLAAPIVGWVLVALLSALLGVSLRQQLFGLGAYVGFLGATGLAILIPIVVGSEACPDGQLGSSRVCGASQACATSCYASSTTTALFAYSAILIIGLSILVFAVLRKQSKIGRPGGSG